MTSLRIISPSPFFEYDPVYDEWHMFMFDDFQLRERIRLDNDGLARVTIEGIVPHAPHRPFEPNRFSKSRGRI